MTDVPARGLTWGLIGASWIATESVAPAILAQPNSRIARVFSGSQQRATEFAENIGAQGTDDLDELLSDPEIDAVYISSVNHQHLDQALAAISAGKHVLCEKPLALSLADARTMRDAARRAGVMLATNHHMRNSVPHDIIRRAILSGDLGEVVAVSVRHAVELPESAQGWRTRDVGAGAGVILDITVHDADALRFVLGSDPVSVHAATLSGRMTADGIDESVVGTAHFANGVDVAFFESFVTGNTPTELAVLGTKASYIGNGIQAMQPVGSLTRWENGQAREVELGEREDLYVVGIRRFEAAVLDPTQSPAATAEDGLWSVAFAEAALRSSKSGLAEKVEEPGDTDA
ncbi:Gfo/Idh/MocA family oxidoreductase [Microbacterium sp. K24]|uniref:Gfo/Idh/MocA family protein n=1 Tax=Microbacterium sp. K24 TaxID=2305446 RepID=UPI00109C8FB7|nr:Gfo/Idh/MocA family oxidoreductase [Microbacterium sp. K24]